jgi:hypothetical protein
LQKQAAPFFGGAGFRAAGPKKKSQCLEEKEKKAPGKRTKREKNQKPCPAD